MKLGAAALNWGKRADTTPYKVCVWPRVRCCEGLEGTSVWKPCKCRLRKNGCSEGFLEVPATPKPASRFHQDAEQSCSHISMDRELTAAWVPSQKSTRTRAPSSPPSRGLPSALCPLSPGRTTAWLPLPGSSALVTLLSLHQTGSSNGPSTWMGLRSITLEVPLPSLLACSHCAFAHPPQHQVSVVVDTCSPPAHLSRAAPVNSAPLLSLVLSPVWDALPLELHQPFPAPLRLLPTA